MFIKRVGVELALMEGARPLSAVLHMHRHGLLVCKLLLKRDHLAVPVPQWPPAQHILDRDKRKRGEHRPLRLVLGACHRAPYTFYSARLPGAGLPLCPATVLELWLHLYDPMWPYAPLFHFKGSDPRVHPLTRRVHHVEHRCWTPATAVAMPVLHVDQTECECGVRVRMQLRPFTVAVCNHT